MQVNQVLENVKETDRKVGSCDADTNTNTGRDSVPQTPRQKERKSRIKVLFPSDTSVRNNEKEMTSLGITKEEFKNLEKNLDEAFSDLYKYLKSKEEQYCGCGEKGCDDEDDDEDEDEEYCTDVITNFNVEIKNLTINC